jgi:ABC-2 type transport system permease protein
MDRVRRVRRLVRKEFLQIVRNRQNFRILLIAPVFQLLLFGYAVRMDVENVSTAIVDQNRSSMSRTLIDSFTESGYFTVKYSLSEYDGVDDLLDSGKISVAILVPPDLDRVIKGEKTAQIAVLIDGVNTTTANTVMSYSQAILESFSQDILAERIDRARGLRNEFGRHNLILPSMEVSPRAWFNPNLDSKEFFIPGTLTLILTFFTMILTSMAIVREKETGTIEQLMVTPLSSLEMVIGKTIPCVAISVVNILSVTALALLWFQPAFRGSLLFFLGYSFIYILTCLGIGITISAFCRTQQQAILTSFMVLQPSTILSGFVFPIENMPVVIQWLTYLNPLRYYIIVSREVFLKGLGIAELWPQLAPIALMTIFYLGLAAALFKKRID